MPEAIKVELIPHQKEWAAIAEAEAASLKQILGPVLVTVHHIGSTSIAGISAKPIVDLLPVVTNLSELDEKQPLLVEAGYEWFGEYGIANRRYMIVNDPLTGKRKVQLHCFPVGDYEVEKHLAFRDYMRAHPHIARQYEAEKQRCRDLFPDNSHAYSDAKSEWIGGQISDALAFYRSGSGSSL